MKQKIFFVLLCLLCVVLQLKSQIVNSGVFKIQETTVVFLGENYTNKLGGIHNCNGELYLEGNFINNGTTESTAGSVNFISTGNQTQTISGSANSINFYNLKVDMVHGLRKGVSVADNFGLYVKNAVLLNNGDLRLIGEAQLIQTAIGANLNSSINGILHKDQQGYPSAYGYNHWSSPVNNGGTFALNGGLFDGTDSNINPYNTQQVLFDSSSLEGKPSILDGGGNVITPLTISERWLYKFSRGGTGNYADWIKLDENSSLIPGEGYLMKGTNTTDLQQNYVFKGEPNNGTYLIPVGVGESNLLGNPYPSALDADKFITDNLSLFDGTLYFWVEGGSPSHNLSDYLGGYAVRNLSTGVSASLMTASAGIGTANTATPTQYIAVGQGFFIDTNGTGNIAFNNSQRVFKLESLGESIHYKTESLKNSSDDSIVRIGYEDPEGFHRQIALCFLPNSTADFGYNPGYDALISGEREDELFFIIENDLSKKYIIQGVGAFDELIEYDLGLVMAEAGKHTIMLDGVENFTNSVFLKDVLLNRTYNLSESNYEITLPPGIYLDRFKLVFTESTLTVENFQDKFLKAYYNANNSSIVLKNLKRIEIEEVEIFNNIGQVVYKSNTNLNNNVDIEIPFNHTNGIYFVKIYSKYKEETHKILKL